MLDKAKAMNELIDSVRDHYQDKQIKHEVVAKNNNVALNGISVSHKSTDKARVLGIVYIDDYVDQIAKGKMTQVEALNEIFRTIDKSLLSSIPNEYLNIGEFIQDKERISKMIHRCLVNSIMNKEKNMNVPHKSFFDLDIVYKIFLDDKSTISITDDILRYMGMSLDEIDAIALKNDRNSYTIMNLMSLLRRSLPFEQDCDQNIEFPMYVVTNNARWYGASAMLDDDVMARMGEQFGENVVVLPCSVHEIICVPRSFATDIIDLLELVTCVNNEEVMPQDMLSNRLFRS